MSRAERRFVVAVVLLYCVGSALWGRYPFYNYPLFSDSPRWYDTYRITDQSDRRISRKSLSFESSYDAHLTSMIGRRVTTYYRWGVHMDEADLREVAEHYFADHPNTTALHFKRSTFATLDNGSFGFQRFQEWEFRPPVSRP